MLGPPRPGRVRGVAHVHHHQPPAAANPLATGDFSRELAEFARRFPSLQRELIDRRDRHMARRLVALLRDGQRVASTCRFS